MSIDRLAMLVAVLGSGLVFFVEFTRKLIEENERSRSKSHHPSQGWR